MTAVLYCVAAALVFFLGAVQLASDGIFRSAANPRSLPALIAPRTGVTIYRVFERAAPAPFALSMLSRAALDGDDLDTASAYAKRLPLSPWRSDLLGRIALARGDNASAQRDFLAAGDIFAVGSEIDALAQRDPRAAYDLQMRLKDRLQKSGTHPDLVAEAYWRLGVLSAKQGLKERALSEYRQAVDLSPLSSKFLISAGFQAYDLQRNAAARRYFARAISADPCSGDALAGAGMVALRDGRRNAAQTYAARSEACDPNSQALVTLRKQLQ